MMYLVRLSVSLATCQSYGKVLDEWLSIVEVTGVAKQTLSCIKVTIIYCICGHWVSSVLLLIRGCCSLPSTPPTST